MIEVGSMFRSYDACSIDIIMSERYCITFITDGIVYDTKGEILVEKLLFNYFEGDWEQLS